MINFKNIEEKNQLKIFDSVDKKHQIEINIIDDISWFNINNFDFEYYKTFLLMLKDILIFLKKKNITHIKQYIYKNDCEYFKNSLIINLDDDKYIVSTNLENFLDEIINVLGIKKI